VSGPVAVQALVTGLATGAAYGLIALGFTLVHRLTRILALAHGDIVTGAVFVAVLTVLGTMPVAAPFGLASGVAFVVVAVVAGAALSAAVYAFALRPFLPRVSDVPGFLIRPSGDVLGWVAGGLAAGLAVRELLGLPFAQQAYALPDPLGSPGTIGLGGGITVPVRALEVLAIGLVVGVSIERILEVTGAGAVMRAVSDDAGAAALLGIPTERIVLVAFMLAGALAGLAGLLIDPASPIGLQDGVLLGVKGLTAALILRLGSLRHALLGGLLVGVLEAFILATPSLGAKWADVVVLAVLTLVAALRPRGLLAT
jgi:branched-subunit amino acid ABC-type transport system permease component